MARRRWRKGGTRYKDRGIDNEGNVSNHCEVEMIVNIEGIHEKEVHHGFNVRKTRKVYSFVQVRGSMPFFWTQEGLTDVTILGGPELSVRPFKLHFASLHEDYNDGQIFCMNLVQPNKGFEGPLKERFEAVLKLSEYPT